MTDLPKGWVEDALGEICQVAPTDPPLSESAPFISMASVEVGERYPTSSEPRGKRGGIRARSGDLLFARITPCLENGKVAVVPEGVERAGGSTEFIVVRPPNGVLPHLLYYWSLHPDVRVAAHAKMTGTTGRMRLSPSALGEIPFRLPPQPEQGRIVAAIEESFSKLDAGDAGLRTVRQLLKRLREAILDAAVTGRLVPQEPTDTSAAKLLADLGVDPPASRAEPPMGWASVRLGDLAGVISGPAFKSSQFGGPDDGIRLLRGENIEPGSLRWRDTRTWPPDLLDGYEHLFVEATDIILAMDRPVVSAGLKLAQVRPDDLPALLVQRVARIRPVRDCFLRYMWLVMQDRRFVAHLLSGQVGTQLPHITLRAIREYELAVPGPDEMPRLLAEADRQLSVVEACERAVDAGLARSAALRRSVLKAAFEGKLVPQDPSDEPASVLLERIRAERAEAPKPARRGRRTA